MAAQAAERSVAPRATIRRFDIFAEYNRLTYERKGMPPDQARGFALWLAKVVAARKFARSQGVRDALAERLRTGREDLRDAHDIPELGGEPQTDKLFQKEIVERMGEEFYREVLAPAVAQAFEEHRSYEDIRDSLRASWNRGRQRNSHAQRSE
jgi:hypothetical protein